MVILPIDHGVVLNVLYLDKMEMHLRRSACPISLKDILLRIPLSISRGERIRAPYEKLNSCIVSL